MMMLLLAVSSYTLWLRFQVVDMDIADRVQIAEQERHELVISHDFDLLKEKLIEVHRDHWAAAAIAERQARLEVGCLAAMIVILLLFTVNVLFRRPSQKPEVR